MKVVLLTALDIRGNSMFQKFKIAFYAIIVWLVLVLPSQADAVELYADSCKGWDCSYEGQICPQGAVKVRGVEIISVKIKDGWRC